MDVTVSHTIERCAQWLIENYGNSMRSVAHDMRRALKDKP
jgi:hypothetical protein